VIPTEDQIRSDALFLGFTDKDVSRLIEHARRARTGSTDRDGYKRTHGAAGGRMSGVSDPTGEMACDDEQTTPEIERQHDLLFDMFMQAAASKRAVRNTLERLAGLQTYQKPQGHTSTECCEPGCNEPVHKAGRCTADYWRKRRFEQANPGETCPPLTADELEKRNPPRRQRVS
jgi:hypothetical protein